MKNRQETVGISECALLFRSSWRWTIQPYADIPGISFSVYTVHERYNHMSLAIAC